MSVLCRSKCVLLFAAVTTIFGQGTPLSFGLKPGSDGKVPGWQVGPEDFVVRSSDDCSQHTSICTLFAFQGTGVPKTYGNLSQSFSADSFRNQRVALRATLRVDAEKGCRAQMWMRVDLPNNVPGFFDNMAKRPITSANWGTYEIDGAIHPDAQRITIGVMLFGACRVSIDNLEFRALGLIPDPPTFHSVPPPIEDAIKIEWLSQKAFAIRTIDPEDDNFSDLAPLRTMLSGVRVLELGEETHGDGATLYAKERIIRFLHREMGFDVLAWESGFAECEDANHLFQSDVSTQQIERRALFGVWSWSGLLNPLFEYIRSTQSGGSPLLITGFDFQGSYNGYPKRLFDFIEQIDPAIALAGDRELVKHLFARLLSGSDPLPEEREQERDALLRIRNGLEFHAPNAPDKRSLAFYEKVCDNLLALEEDRALPPDSDFRDRRMAANVLWIANDWYKNHKIIVWAASAHIVRNLSAADKGTKRMGDIISSAMGNEAYSVAFSAYRGTFGDPTMIPRAVAAPAAGSLENLLHATGLRYALLDFRAVPKDHWLRGKMLLRPLGYVPMLSDWTSSFDALVYTDIMFPNSASGYVPQDVRTNEHY